ncbi:hypothetical protein VX037_18160 [Gordonia sp. Z-3]|uniref:hypothetical protein n=1 Tax=Gordonia sp. Z-3 TaxID=3115408 RepID=UPI002E2C2900|nr:hypothetical protein [Gordonia sp. Z-3]MED5802952.1 hypothetical protein [Gordonia sp. Z-3]
MKITDFIAARLDDEADYIAGIKVSQAEFPPQGDVASYALGAVRQHESTRRMIDDMMASGGVEVPDDAERAVLCRVVASRWSDHPDFQAEWLWRGTRIRSE